jgi:hypothetical protein
MKICPFKGSLERYKNELNVPERKPRGSVNKSVITRVASVPNVILYLERLRT